MKLEIVPFDVAKDLQELGFDWLVHWMYYYSKFSNDITIHYCDHLSQNVNPKYGFNFNHRYSTDTNELPISAPEQALVVKWFRDVHKVQIRVAAYVSFMNGEIIFNNNHVLVEAYKPNLNIYRTGIATYEEAELEGILGAIKYLKNEKVETS